MQKNRSYPAALLIVGAVVVLGMHALPNLKNPLLNISAALFRSTDMAASGESTDALQQLVEQEAQVRVLEEENALLRRDAAIRGNLVREKYLVRVLFSDPDPLRRAFTVFLPDEHRVGQGDAVVTAGEVLVGVVESVSGRLATILRLDDAALKISAVTEGSDGLVTTDATGSLIMTLVPADEPIADGSAVYTSGADMQLPQGILIGTALRQPASPGDPFAKFRIVPAVPLSNLTSLGILIGN